MNKLNKKMVFTTHTQKVNADGWCSYEQKINIRCNDLLVLLFIQCNTFIYVNTIEKDKKKKHFFWPYTLF